MYGFEQVGRLVKRDLHDGQIVARWHGFLCLLQDFECLLVVFEGLGVVFSDIGGNECLQIKNLNKRFFIECQFLTAVCPFFQVLFS